MSEHVHTFLPVGYSGDYKNWNITARLRCTTCGETVTEQVTGRRVEELFPPERWYPSYLADPGAGYGY